ncbi:sigma-54-dependent transcriptional regulator [Sphingomonas sp. PAMC 26621]|uniref:sigma-54-dependent transcriptional regulator n=1 Tax=Sphingomonas sp. PAMC 26621 TaxID=1112213 RepID=UPI0002896892|nr:sigma-54 dependent transcriptional regulator [Sphingomonas sp. PAMC 26621]
MYPTGTVHLLLVGAPNGAFQLAAAMARDLGAHVVLADSAGDALAVLRNIGCDIVMIDVNQDVAGFITRLRSERIALPVLACGIDASADRAVAAIRAGARDYVPLPPQAELIAAAILSVVHYGTRMVGSDPAFARATALGLAMAPSSAPFLIVGPPGSGKEMLARTVHGASGRPGRCLVVNCASGTDDMLESELFGHAPGAFVGAIARRRGRIEEASAGTIVLRDVEALSTALQVRLLSLLQHTSNASGTSDCAPLGARIVAATHTDLDLAVATGRFNPHLLARIGLVRVVVPPLHARTGDIVPLAHYFGERFALANALPVRAFDAAANAMLQRHAWPGNVRELEDTIHRAVLLNRQESIGAEAIVTADGSSLAGDAAAGASEGEGDGGPFVARTVEDVERDLILNTLRHCRGNRTSASTILGISVRTMRNKLRIFIEAGIPVSPAA